MQLGWDHAVALLITLITCTMQNCVGSVTFSVAAAKLNGWCDRRDVRDSSG